jgi:hypothetical protein
MISSDNCGAVVSSTFRIAMERIGRLVRVISEDRAIGLAIKGYPDPMMRSAAMSDHAETFRRHKEELISAVAEFLGPIEAEIDGPESDPST